MRRRLITALALVSAIALGAPSLVAAAPGGTAAQAITDCNDHAGLTAHYSVATLRTALATMPVDVREYTDCYDVIQKQLFAQLGTSGSGGSGTTGGSSGGSVIPTPLLILIIAARARRADVRRDLDPAQELGRAARTTGRPIRASQAGRPDLNKRPDHPADLT